MNKLTQDLLKGLFDYRDGELYWKVSGSGRKIGVPAGVVNINGYRQMQINGKQYFAHRLIFLYHNGYLPKFLDHIDGDPTNNFIGNLREATRQENGMNRKKRVNLTVVNQHRQDLKAFTGINEIKYGCL